MIDITRYNTSGWNAITIGKNVFWGTGQPCYKWHRDSIQPLTEYDVLADINFRGAVTSTYPMNDELERM
jgi:hypothetical protein